MSIERSDVERGISHGRINKMEKREEVMQAVARGWCHSENEKKVMDVDLALAITDEILAIKPIVAKKSFFAKIYHYLVARNI